MTAPIRARSVLAALFVSIVLAAPPAAAKPPQAEIVVDAETGAVLHEDNADARTQPASLTKMMTLYLAFEALDQGDLRIDQFIPVSERAANMAPSKLGLKPGGSVQVEHAILGLVTRSANDAAVVLAEAMAGSEEKFAERMTARARQLGMRNTVFRNASGLPNADQQTTARDMAILSRALIDNHPRRYHYFGRPQFTYQGTVIRSHNRLMSRYEGMDGIKTGFVNASGFNLAASAKRDGRRLVAVVLGGATARSRDDRVAYLLDRNFGVENRALRPIAATSRTAPKSPKASSTVAQGDAATAPTKSAKPKGSWSVQIGAFKSKKAAQVGLHAVGKKLDGDALAGTVPSVVKKNKMFLARYVGLSKEDAEAACQSLKKKGQDCAVIAGK